MNLKKLLLAYLLACSQNAAALYKEQNMLIDNLPLSEYVTLVITVPETHADAVRKAMGHAGAGKFGNYSFCSFSTKGIAHFMPHENAQPHIGKELVLATVIEEKIETVCSRDSLETVIEAIKAAHPYESTVIEIYPIYQLGCKFTR